MSEPILSTWQIIVVLTVQLIAVGIWLLQKRPNALGGEISLIKSFWLVYAITLWILVPWLLWNQHIGCVVLGISMLIRCLFEIPLCLIKKWRVKYGLFHDYLHLVLSLIVFIMSVLDGSLGWSLLFGLTVVSLLTEIVFVYWFRNETAGPESGVYFVSGDQQFKSINRNTSLIFLPQYLVFFYLLFRSHG